MLIFNNYFSTKIEGNSTLKTRTTVDTGMPFKQGKPQSKDHFQNALSSSQNKYLHDRDAYKAKSFKNHSTKQKFAVILNFLSERQESEKSQSKVIDAVSMSAALSKLQNDEEQLSLFQKHIGVKTSQAAKAELEKFSEDFLKTEDWKNTATKIIGAHRNSGSKQVNGVIPAPYHSNSSKQTINDAAQIQTSITEVSWNRRASKVKSAQVEIPISVNQGTASLTEESHKTQKNQVPQRKQLSVSYSDFLEIEKQNIQRKKEAAAEHAQHLAAISIEEIKRYSVWRDQA